MPPYEIAQLLPTQCTLLSISSVRNFLALKVQLFGGQLLQVTHAWQNLTTHKKVSCCFIYVYCERVLLSIKDPLRIGHITF